LQDNPTARSLLARVGTIAPVLRAHGPQAEIERKLSTATVSAMVEAGLFRIWAPRCFGGLEIDPVNALEVFEEVSRIDSAAGWNLQLSSSIAPAFAWFPDAVVQEVFGGSPDVILGGTLFPPGKAVRVDGGYRLTGRWPFVSGCHHCAWFIAPAILSQDQTASAKAQQQEDELVLAYPAADAQIVDTWDTLGMRGSGSHDVLVNEIFVPEWRTTVLKPNARFGRAFQGALYRLSIWPTTAALAAPALGIARAAIDEFLELSATKTAAYARTPLRERPFVQDKIARAEALLGAGRAYVHESLREAWQSAEAGQTLDVKQKLKVLMATIFAIQAAAKSVDIIHEIAGTTAIRNQFLFQRHFRDIHVITQHAFASTSRYESIGKVMVGSETDWGFISL
jgi:alkylation response protein AidB-like acyl-CoA dehydrogenase